MPNPDTDDPEGADPEAADLPLSIDDLAGIPTTLGYRTTIHADRAETRLSLDARHANRNGRVHGGVHCTILDAAMGFAASRAFARAEGGRTPDTDVLTLTLVTNFVGASDGREMIAVGRIDRHGRSLAFASGEVRDERGTLLATGTATFKRTHSRGAR